MSDQIIKYKSCKVDEPTRQQIQNRIDELVKQRNQLNKVINNLRCSISSDTFPTLAVIDELDLDVYKEDTTQYADNNCYCIKARRLDNNATVYLKRKQLI